MSCWPDEVLVLVGRLLSRVLGFPIHRIRIPMRLSQTYVNMLGIHRGLCIFAFVIYSLPASVFHSLRNIYVLYYQCPYSPTLTAIILVLCPLAVFLGLILAFLGIVVLL